jgi:hypothetical protein
VTGAHEQDVAGHDAHTLKAFCRLEVLAEHVVSRFDPGDPARAGCVEQDPATDQAVLEEVDRSHVSCRRRHRGLGGAVEERALERHVAEGVDVRVSLVVVVEADVVLREAHGP